MPLKTPGSKIQMFGGQQPLRLTAAPLGPERPLSPGKPRGPWKGRGKDTFYCHYALVTCKAGLDLLYIYITCCRRGRCTGTHHWSRSTSLSGSAGLTLKRGEFTKMRLLFLLGSPHSDHGQYWIALLLMDLVMVPRIQKQNDNKSRPWTQQLQSLPLYHQDLDSPAERERRN